METTSILDAVDVWEYREIAGAPEMARILAGKRTGSAVSETTGIARSVLWDVRSGFRHSSSLIWEIPVPFSFTKHQARTFQTRVLSSLGMSPACVTFSRRQQART